MIRLVRRIALMCLVTALFMPTVAIAADPGLRSESALVLDDTGNVVYGKNPDQIRPIASITKLMTAIVILDSGLPLDEKISVSKDDRDLLQLTGSRLSYGAKLSRKEMLYLALMSSENRAASALGRHYPGGLTAFVAAMNAKARALGMSKSTFADPAGLSPENRSTASDLAKLIKATEAYPLISRATTTIGMDVYPFKGRGPLHYNNTNRLLKNASWDIDLSKTGYINEAGRCLVMKANIDGKPLSIVLLNSFGKLTPFGDSNRLRKWLRANS